MKQEHTNETRRKEIIIIITQPNTNSIIKTAKKITEN